ncbi:MAG: type II secretion system protein GspG [Longimicrobiales bacterium]
MILLGISAALYFPDSRQAIIDKAMPVLTPVLTRVANSEMREISYELLRYDQIGRELPSRRRWLRWLEDNFPDESTVDPWGNVYQFYSWADSLALISYGPDKERGTEDDIRFQAVRRSWRRR